MIRFFCASFILFCQPALAEVSYFGKISAVVHDHSPNNDDVNALLDQGSYLGMKGFHQVDDEWDLTYIIEAGFDEDKSETARWSGRQRWLGLRRVGGGEFRLGRQVGPSSIAIERIDAFPGQFSDANTILTSERFFQVGAGYIRQTGNIGFAAMAGEVEGASEKLTADVVGMYFGDSSQYSFSANEQKDLFQTFRLGVSYSPHKNTRLGLAVEEYKDQVVDASDHRAIVASAKHQQQNLTYKLQLGQRKLSSGSESRLTAVGADWAVKENLNLLFEWSRLEQDLLDAPNEEKTVASFGVNYQF